MNQTKSNMTEVKPTLLQRLNTCRKAITVEPTALLLLTGNVLGMTTSVTLALEKTCRVNLNLSDTICDALRNQDTDDNSENEIIVQEYYANLVRYRTLLTSILPFILLVFAGGWMDLSGRRKIMMIVPVIADVIVQTSNIFNVIFFYELSVEYLMFTDAVISSMVGGTSIFLLAVISYMIDITTEENRTFRLGIASFCITIGMPIGTALSGVLLKNFGYFVVFTSVLVLSVINVIYILFGFSDPERTIEHKKHDNRGFFYFMKIFFNPAHLLNSLKVVFMRREDNRSVILCILFLATFLLFGPLYGEGSIMYMSTRYRFGWDELQYSLFQAYNMIITTVGSLITIVLISKFLGWHDSVIGIISTTSKILSSFIFCFALTGTIFYLGPLVDMANGTAYLAFRSIFSKIVEHHEVGKINSLISMSEVIAPLAYVPLYLTVYTATIETFPGVVFLIGTGLTIPPLLVFIWLLYRHLSGKAPNFNKMDCETT